MNTITVELKDLKKAIKALCKCAEKIPKIEGIINFQFRNNKLIMSTFNKSTKVFKIIPAQYTSDETIPMFDFDIDNCKTMLTFLNAHNDYMIFTLNIVSENEMHLCERNSPNVAKFKIRKLEDDFYNLEKIMCEKFGKKIETFDCEVSQLAKRFKNIKTTAKDALKLNKSYSPYITWDDYNLVTCSGASMMIDTGYHPFKSLENIGVHYTFFDNLDKAFDKLNDDINITIYENYIIAGNENTKIISELFHGHGFDYKSILTNGYKKSYTFNTSEFLKSVKTLSDLGKYTRENGTTIILDGTTNEVSRTYGSMRLQFPLELNEPDIKIAFNPKLLLNAINNITTDKFNMYWCGNLSCFIIENEDYARNGGTKNIVMPVRI